MNTSNKIHIIAVSVFSLISLTAQAAEWRSEAELGFIMTNGNSETQNTNGKLSISRETDKWKESGSIEALGSSNTDSETGIESTTSEKYSATAKADYKLSEDNFLFVTADYNDDRFSGFEFQSTLSAGYGRNLFENEKQKLSAEFGPGIRYFKLSPVLGIRTPSDDESLVHAAAYYIYTINEQAALSQDIIVDTGDDVTISESITALKTQIAGRLAMKAAFKVRNTSEVPAGTE